LLYRTTSKENKLAVEIDKLHKKKKHLSTNEELACTLPGHNSYFPVAIAKAKGLWK
jgi:hypothetical protein